jgi:hypothetical protein
LRSESLQKVIVFSLTGHMFAGLWAAQDRQREEQQEEQPEEQREAQGARFLTFVYHYFCASVLENSAGVVASLRQKVIVVSLTGHMYAGLWAGQDRQRHLARSNLQIFPVAKKKRPVSQANDISARRNGGGRRDSM